MHFLSINTHGSRRADSQADPAALDGSHDDPDLPADHDLFADTPAKHQHDFPS
jgi:hypothetical protein